jgi:DNA invertase Pin-like site-specific DNA recombinase
MVYGYARVSTLGQKKDGNSIEAQEAALKNAGAEEIFADASTGAKRDRPQFNLLLEKLKSGDTLIVAKLDRVARSLIDGHQLVNGLIDKGVRVNILNMGVMDNSPASRLSRAMFLAFAEFERDMIIERTKEGKDIAKTKGGFKEGRPRLYTAYQLDSAVKLLETHSYKEVAKMTKISKSTLQRAKRAGAGDKPLEGGN